MSKFFKKGSVEAFEAALSGYPKAVKAKAKQKNNKKKGETLEALDKWMQEDLKASVDSRDPPHLTRVELVRLMEWKLSRGKFRPRLVEFAGSNVEAVVVEATGKGIALGCGGSVEEAVKAIVVLKGIGPATASAILATCCPDHCCFYADEVARTALALAPSVALKYTAREYVAVNDAVTLCAERLNAVGGGGTKWTPHKVELAVWSHCILENTDPPILPSSSSSSSPPSKKRKR